MFTLNNFAILALAGTTIAAPALSERDWNDWSKGGAPQGNWQGHWNHGGDSAPAPTPAAEAPAATSTVWDVQTAYVTMTGDAPSNWGPPSAPEATPTPEASPAAFYNTPAAPAPSASSSGWGSSAPVSNDGSWQSVVAQWRAAGGLPALTPDSTLEANAAKTAQDGNGQMVHELNPGSMAQVLAPGNPSEFESVYVGGWLCERPDLAGLNGICGTEAQGWDHSDGETGHADILSSTSYTKIGCACEGGIWACDLA